MGRRKITLALAPIFQLQEQDSDGEVLQYQSLGEDPQFDLRPMDGVSALVPGWYIFSAELTVLDGELISPCLYPDYGEGLFERNRIELPEPGENGCIEGVVLIRGPLRTLRFDPAIHRVRFRIKAPSLRKISRLGALYKMLSSIQQATRAMFWEDSLAALTVFCGHALRGRLTAGADHVVKRYLELNRRNIRGYSHWVALFNSSPTPCERESLRADEGRTGPLISIVLPTHNTSLPLLRKCIDSVRNQSYTNWQLCIADDVSSSAVRRVLKEYADQDPRIQVHLRGHHGHISETSNDALGMATGEYVGFLDHDDKLSVDALSEVVRAIEGNPDAALFYSDEDKVDESGKRFDPHFKPAWNPELLLSQNYICHFLVVQTALVRALGGFRVGLEGAQDHDLVLRCVERLQRHQIVHIPKVLYHWRAISGSTALGNKQKSYAQEAGRLAVEQHLLRTGVDASVESLPSGYYSVCRKLGKDAPLLTIVIPTRDHKHMLSVCIDSILAKTEYPNYRIVLVDNGSVEADALRYLAALRENPRIMVLEYPAPFNFSAIVNRGIRHSQGELLCILNNDVEVITPGWLDEMAVQALRPEVGVVGCMLYYPDNTIQHAGVVLGMGGVAGHVHLRLSRGSAGYIGRAGIAQNFSAVTGACMVLRREVFEEVGGLDEGLPVAFNDIDFCLRVRQRGYFNVWTPRAELYHHESASRGYEDTPHKMARFDLEVSAMKRRWGDSLREDPAYNPNLSLDSSHFELAFPPRLVGGNAARALAPLHKVP